MSTLPARHSPLRIFAFSSVATVAALLTILFARGVSAVIVATILIMVEIAFSFDNAILNAKILGTMSRFWQNMFLTIGALIAIFGMRVIFPILIVSITAGLSWGQVFDLALNHPQIYAEKLKHAHPTISAFGGGFLLMLALHFFVDETRKILWWHSLEQPMQRLATNWMPLVIASAAVLATAILPLNHHKKETLVAGILGVLLYKAIHVVSNYFGRVQRAQSHGLPLVGTAAFVSFLYLELLDASFSFDGVLGAFAVTGEVVLIAVGLGIGALWVRSLTIFMVRRGSLDKYVYIDHGAHYTIFALACLLLVSIFYDVPEVITGGLGLSIIVASIIASRQARLAHMAPKAN